VYIEAYAPNPPTHERQPVNPNPEPAEADQCDDGHGLSDKEMAEILASMPPTSCEVSLEGIDSTLVSIAANLEEVAALVSRLVEVLDVSLERITQALAPPP